MLSRVALAQTVLAVLPHTAADGIRGTLARNALRLPGFYSVDFGVAKSLALIELTRPPASARRFSQRG